MNSFLEENGSTERIDHRSYEAQNIYRIPEPKIGYQAAAMEQRGLNTRRGEKWHQAHLRNLAQTFAPPNDTAWHEQETIRLIEYDQQHRLDVTRSPE